MPVSDLPIPPVAPQPSGHSSNPSATSASRPKLYLLDYGAGNVRSLANSINRLGYDFEWIKEAADFEKADVSKPTGVVFFFFFLVLFFSFWLGQISLVLTQYQRKISISIPPPLFFFLSLSLSLPPSPTQPNTSSNIENHSQKLIFPGVGNFGHAMKSLETSGLRAPLLSYLSAGKPYFGICIGMQALFQSSEESPGAQGLGVIPGPVGRFEREDSNAADGSGVKSIPHMGWGSVRKAWEGEQGLKELMLPEEAYYFVHTFRALYAKEGGEGEGEVDGSVNKVTGSIAPFVHTLTRYGSEYFVSSVRFGNIFGTQFHPEKSGPAGLDLLRRWLEATPEELVAKPVDSRSWVNSSSSDPDSKSDSDSKFKPFPAAPTRRIVACLDVRSNDQGDLIVTKGDQYDVREAEGAQDVRNLGLPVELSQRYYHEGADEICFLNITSFRNSALQDQPMLEVVRAAAETVFVPLTVGGGIKDTVDPDGTRRSALEVAGAYFRAGADKVSIGSEAVIAVEEMLNREKKGEKGLTGVTGIETIAEGYGTQAVVVSIDPKRVYVDISDPDWKAKFPQAHLPSLIIGKEAISATAKDEQDKAWWYQCTIRGGREVRDIDVVQLAQGVERLGAGEILLNSVDRDGSGVGFDLDLVRLVKKSVSIPVVASSGAGKPSDFSAVFETTGVEAALAAGIFHRKEVPLEDVKKQLQEDQINVRLTALDTDV